MQTLKESGYQGWPTISNSLDVCFIWYSRSTLTGKQCSDLVWTSFRRTVDTGKLGERDNAWRDLVRVLIPSKHYSKSVEQLRDEAIASQRLPRLRKGKEWVGPFLYMEPRPPMPFGDNGNCILQAEAPEHSAGIPLGYQVHPDLSISLAVGTPAA